MGEKPFVSVVIPVYNDLDRLRACLTALEAQSYACDRYEVIVVDNASSQPVCPAVAGFGHVVLEAEPQRGSYVARNRGVAAARGDVLAFTDADCRPAEDWIEAGVAELEANPSCGLVAGRVRVFAEDPAAPTVVERYELAFGFPQERYARLGFGATANLFTRRDVFESVGGFDPSLQSGGDREWGLRATASGFKAIYGDAVRIDHPARKTWGELVKKTVRTNRGMFELARKQGYGAGHATKLALADLKPPVRWIARRLQSDEPAGLRAKLSVIAVLMAHRWLRAGIWLSLGAGVVVGHIRHGRETQ